MGRAEGEQQSHLEAGKRPASRAATRRRVGATLFTGERRLCNGTVTGGIETGGCRQDERPVLHARGEILNEYATRGWIMVCEEPCDSLPALLREWVSAWS